MKGSKSLSREGRVNGKRGPIYQNLRAILRVEIRGVRSMNCEGEEQFIKNKRANRLNFFSGRKEGEGKRDIRGENS